MDPAAPPPTEPPVLLAGNPFMPAELQAMALDDVVRRVLPGAFVPWAAPDSSELRAACAGALVGPRLRRGSALGRLTAAWIHGCAPPPAELELLVARFHRAPRPAAGPPVRLNEARLLDSEVVLLAGVPVTTGARTALDVAFHAPEEVALPALGRLVASPRFGCPPGRLRQLVEQTGRSPGKRRALALLDRVLSMAEEGRR